MSQHSLQDILADVTPKQAEVLDLAADGLTSKQIAIDLGIAPRTVDQRIDTLRRKLDGISRNDLVREYRRWKDICGRTTYDRIPLTADELEEALKARQPGEDLVFRDAMTFQDRASWDPRRTWLRPGLRPADLSIGTKLVLMLAGSVLLIAAAVLSVSFSTGLMSLLGK